MVDLRTRLTTEVLENIRGYFGDRLARTLIRTNVKLAEAPSFGVPIFDHAPESNGAVDYWCFALEVLERHGVRIGEEDFRAVAGDLVTDEIYAVDEDWVEEEGESETGEDGGDEPFADLESACAEAEQEDLPSPGETEPGAAPVVPRPDPIEPDAGVAESDLVAPPGDREERSPGESSGINGT